MDQTIINLLIISNSFLSNISEKNNQIWDTVLAITIFVGIIMIFILILLLGAGYYYRILYNYPQKK